MTQDTERNTEASARKKPGLDALFEDIFGLNIRGLKTIWHLFWKPSEVFEAARDIHWKDQYTPTIRLYFSILAVILFFQFIWAGENSFLENSFREILAPVLAGSEGAVFTLEEIVDQAVRVYIVLYPFTLGFLALIAAMLTHIWGKGAGFTTRVRLYFASIIPLTFVGFIVNIATANVSADYTFVVFAGSFIPTLLVGYLTVFRGLKPTHETGRSWRAILFSLIVIFIFGLNGLIAQIATGIVVGYNEAHVEYLEARENADASTASD